MDLTADRAHPTSARSTFVVQVDAALMSAAFLDGAQHDVSFTHWLEDALRLKLARAPRTASVDSALVALFSAVAETDPDGLPEQLRAVYAAINRAWGRYWVAPRVTVEMIEDGAIPPDEMMPRLNRATVAADWPALTASARATGVVAATGN